MVLLLDWEKTFDEVRQEAVHVALDRLDIDPKLLRMIKAMYRNPTFMVTQDGHESNYHQQETGI